MGVVYKAHDPHIDRMVAIKVLRPDRVTNEALVKRFLNEAKAIGRFSHPNIVTVYDVGRDQGTVFIAEEFLEGTPLDEFLKENKLDTEKIVEFGIQVADALAFCAPERDHPPRHQAFQYHLHPRGANKDHRFRHRAYRGRQRPAADPGRGNSGHSVLHVAGAVARKGHRWPQRPLFPRRHALRAGREEKAVHRKEPSLHFHCDHPKSPGPSP